MVNLVAYPSALREKHNNHCAERPTHHIKPGHLVMVRRDDKHRIEWPLGKITHIFPDSDGVVRTAKVEEGGQRSTRSVAFIVPLRLDCKEADAVTQTDERNDSYVEGEEEVAADHPQSPVPSDIPDGSADQLPALAESGPVSNIEGGNLQHDRVPVQPAQPLSPELEPIEATHADSPGDEASPISTPTRLQRTAAQRQRQLL